VLRTGAAPRVAFELRGGDTPIDEAVASL
jgi:hypothetical protein